LHIAIHYNQHCLQDEFRPSAPTRTAFRIHHSAFIIHHSAFSIQHSTQILPTMKRILPLLLAAGAALAADAPDPKQDPRRTYATDGWELAFELRIEGA